jgi:hypothetical protein
MIQEVGGLHTEDARQRCDLAHSRVTYGACPYPLDLLLRKITECHTSYRGVSVGLSRLGVPDNLEQVLKPTAYAARLFGLSYGSPLA